MTQILRPVFISTGNFHVLVYILPKFYFFLDTKLCIILILFAVFPLFSFLDQIDPGSDLIPDFSTVDYHDLAS